MQATSGTSEQDLLLLASNCASFTTNISKYSAESLQPQHVEAVAEFFSTAPEIAEFKFNGGLKSQMGEYLPGSDSVRFAVSKLAASIAQCCRAIRTVRLSDPCYVSPECMRQLAVELLHSSQEIDTLEMSFIYVDIKVLATFVESHNVPKALLIKNCTFVEHTLAEGLGMLANSCRLTTINFEGSNMSAPRIQCLAEKMQAAGESCTVERLILSCCNAGDPGARAVAQMLKTNKSVRELHVGQNMIGSVGICALCKSLMVNRTLRKLTLWGNDISSREAVDELARAIEGNRSVSELIMGYCRIDGEAARKFAAALSKSAGIERLMLYGNNLGDVGACALTSGIAQQHHAFPGGGVSSLDLSKNAISHIGARAVAELVRKDMRIKHVRLLKNPIGEEGRDVLQAAIDSRKCAVTVIYDD